MKRHTAIFAIVLTVAFIAIQFVRVERSNPMGAGDPEVLREVQWLLRRACYDCHSDETRWPWYSRISRLSWWIVKDVEHGLSNLDFSRWSNDPVLEPTPAQRLTWICRDVREGIMPPGSYLLVHAAARLSEGDKGLICEWADRAREAIRSER